MMRFAEDVAFAPSGGQVAPFQHYFHFDTQRFIAPHWQFDIHSAIGLNQAADNLAFTGVVLSHRF